MTGLGVVVVRPEHLHLHEGAEETAPALSTAQVPRAQYPDAQVHGGRRGRSVPVASEEFSDYQGLTKSSSLSILWLLYS